MARMPEEVSVKLSVDQEALLKVRQQLEDLQEAVDALAAKLEMVCEWKKEDVLPPHHQTDRGTVIHDPGGTPL